MVRSCFTTAVNRIFYFRQVKSSAVLDYIVKALQPVHLTLAPSTRFKMGCCGSTQNKYCLAVPILPAGKACEKHVPCGNPPEKPNVTFRFKLKAPKHVVFNYMTKRKDPKDADNMKVPGLVVIEEGEPGSPWGAMMNACMVRRCRTLTSSNGRPSILTCGRGAARRRRNPS